MKKRSYSLGQLKAVNATQSDLYPKFCFTKSSEKRLLIESAETDSTKKAYHAVIVKHLQGTHNFEIGQEVFLENESAIGTIVAIENNIATVNFDFEFQPQTVDVDLSDRRSVSEILLKHEELRDKFYTSITGDRPSIRLMFSNVLVSVDEDGQPIISEEKGIIIPVSNEIENILSGKNSFIGTDNELDLISGYKPRTHKNDYKPVNVPVRTDNSDIAQIIRDFVEENEIKLADEFNINDFVDAKMKEYSLV
jgi:hypothetical protein